MCAFITQKLDHGKEMKDEDLVSTILVPLSTWGNIHKRVVTFIENNDISEIATAIRKIRNAYKDCVFGKISHDQAEQAFSMLEEFPRAGSTIISKMLHFITLGSFIPADDNILLVFTGTKGGKGVGNYAQYVDLTSDYYTRNKEHINTIAGNNDIPASYVIDKYVWFRCSREKEPD